MGDTQGRSRPRSYNLADLISIVAETVPDRIALDCDGDRRTFRQLIERADSLARWLSARGIRRNDTVGVHAINCVEYVEASLAACMLGAVPANINFRYTVEETRYLYDNADLKALVYGAEIDDVVAASVDAAPQLRALVRIGKPGDDARPGVTDFETAVATGGPPLDDSGRSGDDVWLLYTGGTTGHPKGVMWTHEAMFFNGFAGGGAFSAQGPIRTPDELADRVRTNPPLVHLPCGPLMHGAGMWATMIGLLAGHTVHLNGRPDFNAEYVLDKIDRERVSLITLVGDAMALPLLDALRAHPGRWNLSTVVAFSSAGALLSEHVRDGLKEFLPAHAVMANGIGSSEAGQFGSGSKDAGGGLLRIAGGDHVRVLVDDTRFAEPGETGIVIRTGYLPLGYFKDPEKTAATYRVIDGRRWALTGDIARLESDGTITVFGRGSQCINTGGEKVFTEEVEEVVRACAGVYDAQVVGVPDPRWGRRVVAVISLRSGAAFDPTALRNQCRTRLSGYKIPKDFVVVDEVRRNPVGKADYRWALATAEAALSGSGDASRADDANGAAARAAAAYDSTHTN